MVLFSFCLPPIKETCQGPASGRSLCSCSPAQSPPPGSVQGPRQPGCPDGVAPAGPGTQQVPKGWGGDVEGT